MLEREINLLAPTIIRRRTARIYMDRAGHMLRFLVFLAAVLVGVIAGAYVVVRWTAASLTPGDTTTDERNRAVAADVRRINAQLDAIKKWQEENPAWTPHLPEVFAAMPAGIVLTHIGVTAETAALELGGTFPRREALVTFQRQLEGLPWVEAVKSPLSNFETGTDAQFTLEVSRKEKL